MDDELMMNGVSEITQKQNNDKTKSIELLESERYSSSEEEVDGFITRGCWFLIICCTN